MYIVKLKLDGLLDVEADEGKKQLKLVEPIFIFKNGLKDGTTWFSKENVLAVRNGAHQVAVFMSFCNIYWQFCQYIQVQNDLAANKSLKLTANPLRLRLAVVGSLA